MSHVPGDPRWPDVLSLAVHELRTPTTVVAGYVRMLLKDAAGPLTEPQRHLLEEAEKSCTRLSALLGEMSELASLEAETITFARLPIDLPAVMALAVSRLPPLSGGREVTVDLRCLPATSLPAGDAGRLRAAFSAVLLAVRRELVASTRLLVSETVRDKGDGPVSWIVMAEPEHASALETASESTLTIFDEWRGGCGLSLGVARRILEHHGGRIWSPPEGLKAGAIIALPHQRSQ